MPSPASPRRIMIQMLALASCAMAAPAGAGAQPARERIDALVERIAKGDQVESAEAARRLAELVVGPVAEAIGPLDGRPAGEQLRLRMALGRLSAELRVRLLRLDVPAEDRALLDAFVADNEELVLRLFDDNYRARQAAVQQVPLARNSGAGVVLAAKVNDEDEDVAITALEAALKLADPVVARGLRRYVRDATDAVRTRQLPNMERELLEALGRLVSESIKVLGEARDADSVSTIIEAVDFFTEANLWNERSSLVDAIQALEKIGDRHATPALLKLVARPLPMQRREIEGKSVTQTLGDLAMLAAARLNDIPPSELNMIAPPGDATFAGFAGDEARAAAQKLLRERIAAGASRGAERRPPRPGEGG